MVELKIRYIRVERASTQSWMTIRLPHEMTFNSAEVWAFKLLGFDWEAVTAWTDEL